MPGHCHVLIARTAQEMAGVLYDEQMTDNVIYAAAKRQGMTRGKYVKAKWPLLVQQARATLATMLQTSTDDRLKEQIAEALIQDNALMRGRKNLV